MKLTPTTHITQTERKHIASLMATKPVIGQSYKINRKIYEMASASVIRIHSFEIDGYGRRIEDVQSVVVAM